MSNNENGYIIRLGQLDAFIISEDFSDFLKEKYLTAKVEGILDSYGIPLVVSQEAVDYLNKLSESDS